jgi:DNA-binding MarR family transcriptional regulator
MCVYYCATTRMKKFFNDITDALNMLAGIENALNITNFSPNELKVFYSIISNEVNSGSQCNISDVVESSGMSRSTVYKTLRKLSGEGIIALDQSPEDKREYLVTFS